MINTTFLLVLLTLGDAGQSNVAFVNTDSLNTCKIKIKIKIKIKNKNKMLSTIISTSGTTVLENRCFKSKLTFSKFSHDTKKQVTQSNYLVSLSNEKANVRTIESRRCTAEKEKLLAADDKTKTYCATSTQHLLKGHHHE